VVFIGYLLLIISCSAILTIFSNKKVTYVSKLYPRTANCLGGYGYLSIGWLTCAPGSEVIFSAREDDRGDEKM
jgi:hypothetical protein